MESYTKMSLRDVRLFRSGMLVRKSDEKHVLEVLTVDYGKGLVVMRRARWWRIIWTAIGQLFRDLLS